MSGTLYICGTPIGNMEDITLRSLRILKEVDLIAAEDTRHTIKLLNFYDIHTSMTSYHEHNKEIKNKQLIEQLIEGKDIALVSDAGMPGISDPGQELIAECLKEGIPVTSAPGPTAVVTAMVLSGINARSFIFEGFLPSNKQKKLEVIDRLLYEQRPVVFYEAPHDLLETLRFLYKRLGDRPVAVIREITKKHEEIVKGTLSHCIDYFNLNNPKGEIVLILEGADKTAMIEQSRRKWDGLTLEEHIAQHVHGGSTEKEAMRLVARDRGIPRRDIYSRIKIDGKS